MVESDDDRADLTDSRVLLRVENLTKYYPITTGILETLLGRTGQVRALHGVDLELYAGETLGIVGESGCGKSTLGRTILQLEPPTDGHVFYDGMDLTQVSSHEMRTYRKELQYIFQNPFSSLNPRLTVGDIIGEPLDIHGLATGIARRDRIHELLERVGLRQSHANRFPHEFSGGQRQRIGIARALAVDPSVIVCDEPVSALDVSVQAQILNLLMDLQEDLKLTYIFIGHDLSVVEHISDRIAVMYLGEIVELGTVDEIFSPPHHPYTEALLSAIPEPDPLWEGDRIILTGTVPSAVDPPSGCTFHTRCPRIIPPSQFDVSQKTWHAIMLLRRDLESGTVPLEKARTDHNELDVEDISALVRSTYGLPDHLGDSSAEETVSKVLEYVASEEFEQAVQVLSRTFRTPCTEQVPALVDRDHHPIACHLFDERYADVDMETDPIVCDAVGPRVAPDDTDDTD